jgi:hypothetical protein
VYHSPQIRGIVLRCGSRRHPHILCQSCWGSVVLLVDAAPRGWSARVATPGGFVPLGFTDIGEVRSFWFCFLLVLIICSSNSIPYPIRQRVYHLTSRRPLYNVIKYATSFPIIYPSAAQRIVVSDLVAERDIQVRNEPLWHGENQLFRLWCISRSPTR